MAHDAIIAKVEKHSIPLPPDVDWPDGTEVRVQLAPEQSGDKDLPTLGEIMAKYTGIADDLPEDLAENHDHYLYGLPKKAK